MRTKLLPLGIKNPLKTELPTLIALEAIGQPWFCETHRSDLQAIGLVAGILAAEGSEIHLVSRALLSALEAEEMDIESMRSLVMNVSAWLQKQPNVRVQAAIDRLLGGLTRKAA